VEGTLPAVDDEAPEACGFRASLAGVLDVADLPALGDDMMCFVVDRGGGVGVVGEEVSGDSLVDMGGETLDGVGGNE
jgi:hypothetical protein